MLQAVHIERCTGFPSIEGLSLVLFRIYEPGKLRPNDRPLCYQGGERRIYICIHIHVSRTSLAAALEVKLKKENNRQRRQSAQAALLIRGDELTSYTRQH